MITYRLAIDKYKDDLSGTGARLFGGRWNKVGTPVLYTTENISLAVLEILVRADKHSIPPTYKLMRIEIPDTVSHTIISRTKLKKGWVDDPDYTQWMGNEFVRANKSLVLKIPSAIVEEEHNFIINPNHVEFKKIKLRAHSSFQFDKRLFLANE